MSRPDGEQPVPRTGARVLLVDPDQRVLLIHEYLWPRDGRTQWITPGGGIEPGEAAVRAAEREAFEETGLRITLPDDAVPVHRTQRLWQAPGVTYRQDDEFYLVRVERDPPLRTAALTDSERDLWIGYRWWTVEQLRATSDRVLPADLGDVLHRALRAPAGG